MQVSTEQKLGEKSSDLCARLHSAFPHCDTYHDLLDIRPKAIKLEKSNNGSTEYLVRHLSSTNFQIHCPRTFALFSGFHANILSVVSTMIGRYEYPIGGATAALIWDDPQNVTFQSAQGVSYPSDTPCHKLFPKAGIRFFAKQLTTQLRSAGIEQITFQPLESYWKKHIYYTRDRTSHDLEWYEMRDSANICATQERMLKQYRKLFCYYGIERADNVSKILLK